MTSPTTARPTSGETIESREPGAAVGVTREATIRECINVKVLLLNIGGRSHDWIRGFDAGTNAFIDALEKLASSPAPDATVSEPLQSRVLPWLLECFGPIIPYDKTERNHRFLEEALELVQACGCTQNEAHQLVDYVYGRDQGDINQEVGGVMITLAALCIANGFDMHAAGEIELARIWTKVEQIRAKQAAKPKHSPLPAASSTQDVGREATASARDVVIEEVRQEIVLAIAFLTRDGGTDRITETVRQLSLRLAKADAKIRSLAQGGKP